MPPIANAFKSAADVYASQLPPGGVQRCENKGYRYARNVEAAGGLEIDIVKVDGTRLIPVALRNRNHDRDYRTEQEHETDTIDKRQLGPENLQRERQGR